MSSIFVDGAMRYPTKNPVRKIAMYKIMKVNPHKFIPHNQIYIANIVLLLSFM